MAKREKSKPKGSARGGRKGTRKGGTGRPGTAVAKAGAAMSGQAAAVGQSARSGGGTRPLWVPEGVDLHFVPEEVQRAIGEVVQPVYERFVLGVDDPLEMSLGVTLAHLLWLEVLQQFDLKREYTEITAVLKLRDDHSSAIDQHLRIIYSKVKVGYLLARLRELRQKLGEDAEDGSSFPEVPSEGGRRPAEGGLQSPNPGGSPALDPSHPDDPSHAEAPSHPDEPRHAEDPSHPDDARPARGTRSARVSDPADNPTEGRPRSGEAGGPPSVSPTPAATRTIHGDCPQRPVTPDTPDSQNPLAFANEAPPGPPYPEQRDSADQNGGPGAPGGVDAGGRA